MPIHAHRPCGLSSSSLQSLPPNIPLCTPDGQEITHIQVVGFGPHQRAIVHCDFEELENLRRTVDLLYQTDDFELAAKLRESEQTIASLEARVRELELARDSLFKDAPTHEREPDPHPDDLLTPTLFPEGA